MNLMQLKYLVEVEKTGSITKAASNLFMGQPNLSKAIKEVENEYGTAIFRRISKGVEPTEKGAAFLECAKTIIQQLDKMETILKPDNAELKSLKIAIPRASYIANAFSYFINSLDRNERFSVNFRETNALNSINGVSDGEYSFAIIRFEEAYEDFFISMLKDKEFYYEEIWNFPYLVLMTEKDPLAEKEDLVTSDLDNYIEIIQGDTTVPYLSTRYLKKTNASDKSRIFVYDRGSQFDLLDSVPNSFMWVSPFTKEQLTHFRLVQKPCSDIVYRGKDLLIMPKHYKPTDLDKAFLEEIRKVKNVLASQYEQ
jgi:DNA-binding transcriptional LysR family regulator